MKDIDRHHQRLMPKDGWYTRELSVGFNTCELRCAGKGMEAEFFMSPESGLMSSVRANWNYAFWTYSNQVSGKLNEDRIARLCRKRNLGSN